MLKKEDSVFLGRRVRLSIADVYRVKRVDDLNERI